ncbi:hypothetical protein ABB02_01446 [Clostridiaceae bacterium JG1575]|nr:hypothetical protein ABB02_01446 [Clostridiaceae bacterium JG1575]
MNQKLHPILVVVLILIGFSIVGYLIRALAQMMGAALLIGIAYFLYTKFGARNDEDAGAR